MITIKTEDIAQVAEKLSVAENTEKALRVLDVPEFEPDDSKLKGEVA